MADWRQQRPTAGSSLRKLVDLLRAGRAHEGAVERVARWSRRHLADMVNRRFGVPTLADMLVDDGRLCTDAESFLTHLFPGLDVKGYLDEFAAIEPEIERRRAVLRNNPTGWGNERETSRTLYGMVRAARPEHVWETGVADGVSSFVMLGAMDRNGTGTLHSIDISHDVGSVVRPEERERWDLRVLDRRQPNVSLLEVARSLPDLDIFIHDSDHSRRWHDRELAAAIPKLRPGGIVAFDDADWSFAFTDLCRSKHLTPLLLVDQRKYFAAARWPG